MHTEHRRSNTGLAWRETTTCQQRVARVAESLEEPQDKSILCQVVGQDSGAWNMNFELNDIKDSWMVLLRVDHHNLNALPMDWGDL